MLDMDSNDQAERPASSRAAQACCYAARRNLPPASCSVVGRRRTLMRSISKRVRTVRELFLQRFRHLQRVQLLDDLVCPGEYRLGDRQAERSGGFQIDQDLELRWLLDGEIGGLGPLQDLVHVDCSLAIEVREPRAI